jgi:hypothetical protein
MSCKQEEWIETFLKSPLEISSKIIGDDFQNNKEVRQWWWYNPINPSSLRLRKIAYSLIKDYEDLQFVKIDKLNPELSNLDLILLEKILTVPYYIQSTKSIAVFKNSDISSCLVLYGTDLHRFLIESTYQ